MLSNKKYFYSCFVLIILLSGCSSNHNAVSTFGKRKYAKGYYSFFPSSHKEPKTVKTNSPVSRAITSSTVPSDNKVGKISSETNTETIAQIESKNEFLQKITGFKGFSSGQEKNLLIPSNFKRTVLFPDTLKESKVEKSQSKTSASKAHLLFILLGLGLFVTGLSINSGAKIFLIITGILFLLGGLIALLQSKKATGTTSLSNKDNESTTSPENNGDTALTPRPTYFGIAGLLLALAGTTIALLGNWFILVGFLLFLVSLILNIICLCQKQRILKGFAIAGLIINILTLLSVIALIIAFNANGGII